MRALVVIAALGLTGCYAGLNGPPGSLIIQDDIGSQNTRFQRILVRAQNGAMRCELVDVPFSGRRGPQSRGRPNENGELFLAPWTVLETATIECTSRFGVSRVVLQKPWPNVVEMPPWEPR